MMTFLPCPDFKQSAQALGSDRLGKQRVEAVQILGVLEDGKDGWASHPAVEMWRGYELALRAYIDAVVDQWVLRGYNNSYMPYAKKGVPYALPWWFGWEYFHRSHQSVLIRKDRHYETKFNVHRGRYVPRYVWPRGAAYPGNYRIANEHIVRKRLHES